MLRVQLAKRVGAAILWSAVMGCNNTSNEAPSRQDTAINTETALDTETTLDAGGDPPSSDTDNCSETIISSQPYDWPSSSYPYQACSDAVATGEAPLIENFDNCTIGVLPNEGRDGAWFHYDDGSDGTLNMEVESNALHLTSSGWSVWGAAVACSIGPFHSDTEHCSYNAGHYAGVRFRAKGRGSLRIGVNTVSTNPVSTGGTCTLSGDSCYDRPGAFAYLTDDWQTFEFPFCTMTPEGWGGVNTPVDPTEIVEFHFGMDAKKDVEVWLDDLAFFTEDSAEKPISCEKPCPLDLVPYPDTITPETSYLELTDELTLHTFDQETTRCGPIRRRYMSYVPRELPVNSRAPVLIALHGSNSSAETFQDFLAHGRLDELAARDGFIVVYGNAAPGVHSSDNPEWLNTGSWRQDTNDDGEVDDVAYLTLVLEDLKGRGVISGDNDIYLIGMSNGGGMVIKAATERPELFSGIAPFMPYVGWEPTLDPVPDLTGTGLKRVIFGYSPADPGLPEGYDEVLAPLPAEWAAALGLPDDVIQNPKVTLLPNPIDEGEAYTGDNAIALRTRDSSVTQLDMSSPDVPGALRLLEFKNGGHLWPTPVQDTSDWNIESFGFRNQDLDASDAIWTFFME